MVFSANNVKPPSVMYPPVSLGLKITTGLDLVTTAFRYLLHRMRLVPCPDFRAPQRQVHISALMAWIFDFQYKLRIRGAEHCPKQHPILFSANHFAFDDPLCMFPAIMAISPEIRTYIMMRDDFFAGFPRWLHKLIDFNEIMRSMGAMQISRDNVTIGQLKPLVSLLRKPDTFLIYPGRTRSRNGAFFEFREDVQDLGSVAFFLAHAQNGHPDLKIPAVPMARSFNPATQYSTIVFGPPRYLEMEPGKRSPDRMEQRAFDYLLFEDMANLVELNAAHLVAAYCYLNALHRKSAQVPLEKMQHTIQHVLETTRHGYIDPLLVQQPEAETAFVIAYLEKKQFLTQNNGILHLNHEAILLAPTPEMPYRRTNPVRYLTNQILHLTNVLDQVEAHLLAN